MYKSIYASGGSGSFGASGKAHRASAVAARKLR